MTGFNSIEGHRRPIEILRRALAAGQPHHAYLFAGPEGIGKSLVAQAFSRAINCVGEAHLQQDCCGKCTHCLRAIEGNHPDIRLIRPDTSKARPVIRIEVVRDLLHQVHFKPYEARRRVIILDDAEAMTEEAANAMLKTLEEPTGETLFILVTSRPRQLLPTIISRCQPMRFSALPRSSVKDHLEMTGLDADTARLCAAFSGGSIGVGKALASEGVLEARRALIEDVARLSSSDVLGVFELASRHAKSGSDNLQSSLESLKTFYRDVALTRCGADSDRVVNVDLRPLVEETSAQLTVDGAIGHIRKIDAVQSDLRAYVDAHLLLEDLFFSLASGR